ncbi:MAG: PEP-CTERM sorting domain-containing protein [Akkermansiaceae bacterium]
MKLKLNWAAFALLTGPLSAATLVDDFTSGLGNWTPTVILDANGGGSNTFAFEVNGSDQLEINTSSYEGIEQYAFTYGGAALAVGEEAQVDISGVPISGNRNLGLYVGGTAPTAGVRQDYITVYAGGNNNLATRGFDGTTEYNNPQSSGAGAQTLFIARTDENTFDVGYYIGDERTVFSTRNPGTANTADFVGIYADVREAGTVGAIDSFRIVSQVPEPSTALLGALAALGLLRRRRA